MSIVSAITEMARYVTQVTHHLPPLADPTPTPGPQLVNTSGITSFFATKIFPILGFVGAAIMIARSSKGEVGKTLTHSLIMLVGVVVAAASVSLMFFGNQLVNLLFGL